MRLLLAVLALSAARTALAADGELGLSAGVHYARGDYGASGTTSILSVPFSARSENGPWILRATAPYLRISGAGAVVAGVGRVDGPGGALLAPLLGPSGRARGAGEEATASGMGDAHASATYVFYGAGQRSGIGLSGKVKFPTGDETRGLGTGSTDVGVQLDAFQRAEKTTLFGGVGYTAFGDSPTLRLENVLSATFGLNHAIDDADAIGAAFDLRQGGSPAPAPQRELTATWTHKLDRHWRTHANVLRGFARGSPDWGAGLSLGYAF